MRRVVGYAALTAIALVAAYGFLAYGPYSLRAEYRRDVAGGLARRVPVALVSETDLARLPVPVQRYLRVSGVVGQPRVRNFRARMHGRFRNGPDQPWMRFVAEQLNVLEGQCCGGSSRFFYMTASRWLIPMQAYHRYTASAATMRVVAAALAPVVSMSGPEATRTETVTLFNDLCVMAPAALVDAPVVWEDARDDAVRAAFTNAGYTIRADLRFAATGVLADFSSDDRSQASEGGSLAPTRWSTPLRGARQFGSVRLAAGGDARWALPGGEFVYIELWLDDVAYNVVDL